MKLKPGNAYGEPHPGNGKEDGSYDGFHFSAHMPDDIGVISGYVTASQFNWLARQLGTPALSVSVEELLRDVVAEYGLKAVDAVMAKLMDERNECSVAEPPVSA